jgi:hypothetical protein
MHRKECKGCQVPGIVRGADGSIDTDGFQLRIGGALHSLLPQGGNLLWTSFLLMEALRVDQRLDPGPPRGVLG